MSEQNGTRPDREAVRQRAVEIVQQEARDLGYIEEDVAELADPDGDGLLALQAVERAILTLLPAEPVQEMREGERKAPVWEGDGPEPARWTAPDGSIVYRSYGDYCDG